MPRRTPPVAPWWNRAAAIARGLGAATVPPADRPDRALGRTMVEPRVARLLTALFLAVVTVAPALEMVRHATSAGELWPGTLGRLGERLGRALRQQGPLAANRLLLSEMVRFEDRLEESSVLVATVVPHARVLAFGALGIGGPEVYPGRDRWLFYRPDVEHVTGPGFLDPSQLARRGRAGDPWERPPRPDPRRALLRFSDDLAARGIGLVVMPTPVKAAVHPERLSWRSSPRERPLDNPSTEALMADLEAVGIAVFSPLTPLPEAGDGPWYLIGDSHWTPATVDRVAAELARWLEQRFALPSATAAWRRAPYRVAGRGDLAQMLELPAWVEGLLPRQQVEVEQVRTSAGAPWRPERGAPVLLLGDSFTNVFSRPDLGWGVGGGLAEQVAYHLRRPVDRIAINAGGAFASREQLARELARDPHRLAGTQVVVLQFAARELSWGDWRLLPLPPPPQPADRPAATAEAANAAPRAPVGERWLEGTVRALGPMPDPRETPYRDAIVGIHLTAVEPAAGEAGVLSREVLLYAWAMRDRTHTPAAELRPGDRIQVRYVPWAEVAPELESYQRLEVDDSATLLLEALWAHDWERR
ncbi:MAG TPA: hypothetical protein VMT16_09560 [Thermoanaerobaculia bacterium]|nr:hypothetical protein [Thermoanaerobaculia bacterium]